MTNVYARMLLVMSLSVGAPWRLSPQLAGQDVLVSGRIEDAATRQPISGVRVISDDSVAVALTDSLGHFELVFSGAGPYVVHADRLGYRTQRFELVLRLQAARYVLLLEPAPIPIEGLTVEAEAALDRLVRNLEARRAAYPHAMRALDRSWIDRFGPTGGSALDLIRQAAPRFFECSRASGALCVRGRFVTFRNPYPEDQILVCIDGLRSFAPVSELFAMPVSSVALVEAYPRSRQVRVYTTDYLLYRARSGQTAFEPVDLPIPGCG